MLLSVVFSFRNEEEVLPECLRRVSEAVAKTGMEAEFVFVNDESSDGSLALLAAERARDPRIKIVNMSRRFGYAPCVLAGLRYARGDAVVYMDADMQDPPELIPDMVEKWRNGADVVNMTRTSRLGESAFKMMVTKMAYKTINLLSDIDIPENTGDFKLLSRRVVEEVVKLEEADPFMRGLVRWVGFRQETLFYQREPRAGGQTHFPLFGSGPVKEFLRGATSFSAAPLYLSFFVGFASSVIAFAVLVHILIQKALGMNLPGWTALMTSILFMGGSLHMAIGLLGIYLARIHSDVKRRPRYIVSEAVGFDGESGASPEEGKEGGS